MAKVLSDVRQQIKALEAEKTRWRNMAEAEQLKAGGKDEADVQQMATLQQESMAVQRQLAALREMELLLMKGAAASSTRDVPQAEGLAKQLYRTERTALSQRLLHTALQCGAVLVKAPCQSGKTSALQLAAAQLPWLQGLPECEQLELCVLWVSMQGPGESLDEALELQLGIKGGWESLCDSYPWSSAGDNAPETRQKVTILVILVIDEAQHLFPARHQGFWNGLKLLAQSAQRGLCVLMAAAYGLECLAPSWCYRVPQRALGPAGASNEATTARTPPPLLVTLPFKFHYSQVVTLAPPAHLSCYFPAALGGEMALTLTWEECEELHGSWADAFGLQLDDHVLRYIYDFAGGQAGSVCLILDYLQAKLVKAEQGDVSMTAGHELTSPGLLQACSAFHPITRMSTLLPDQQQVLLQLLHDGSIDAGLLDEGLRVALSLLYKRGLVVPDERQWEARMHRFTSPMHELVSAHGAYAATQDVRDFQQLVRLMLQRLDPGKLSASAARARRCGRALAGAYDHEVFRAISGLLPVDESGVKAVLSTFVGQLFGVDAALDLYVSAPWCWGFEVLQDGRGLAEPHANRFLPGGTYCKMREQGRLEHIVVLDMRAESMREPKCSADAPADTEDTWVIRACFTEGFRSVWVHGLEKEPFELTVGGG